MAHIKMFMLGY